MYIMEVAKDMYNSMLGLCILDPSRELAERMVPKVDSLTEF